MAKPHWTHSHQEHPLGTTPMWGCQHSECDQQATHGWQRIATDEEVRADAETEGPFGSVVRNMQGPHRVAVFACAEHALEPEQMARTHDATCPAPDPGCECHDGPGS